MKAILTYHSIDRTASVISVHPETLERHLERLATDSVPVLSLDELMSSEHATGVALTFDDAFENFATEALPLLERFGFPATVFVVTDRVGEENRWGSLGLEVPRLPLMDWSTLREISSGLVALGSHSRTHRDLTRLDEEELREEVHGSLERIAAEVGIVPTAFAYPFGLYRSSTVRAVAESGYSSGLTTDLGFVQEDPPVLTLPRLDAYYLRNPGALAHWGTAGFHRRIRRRAAARRIRQALTRRGSRP